MQSYYFAVIRYGVKLGLWNEVMNMGFVTCTLTRMFKSRIMRWKGYVAKMGKKERMKDLLVGTPAGKSTLRR
jgi:hypothetical protein